MAGMTVLLLTSSVVPYAPIKIKSPTVRLAQMLTSIKRWVASGLVDSIVVVDASLTTVDLSHLATKQCRIEWLTMDLRHESERRGKGYCEGRMMAHAIAHSKLLAGADGFWKCTGRLFVSNFKTVAKSRPKGSRFFGTTDPAAPECMDTKFFWVSKEFFTTKLERLTEQVNDADLSTYIERKYFPAHTFTDAMPMRPTLEGIGGSTLQIYGKGYKDLPMDEARRLLPRPDLTVFCLYHDAEVEHYERKGWIAGDMPGVMFVKVGPGEHRFNAKRHLDTTMVPWFRPIGTHFAEYEFLFSLYVAAITGDVRLPEYVGFAHYDMDLTKIDFHTPLHHDSITLLQPCHAGTLIDQRIIVHHGEEVIATCLEMTGQTCARTDALGMCSGYIMHRAIFLLLMLEVAAVIRDKASFLYAKNAEKRYAAAILERYSASVVRAMGLMTIYSPIPHALIQSKVVDLRNDPIPPKPSKVLGFNAGVLPRPYGYLTTERFLEHDYHIVVRQWDQDWKHLRDLGVLVNHEDFRLIEHNGKVYGYGSVVDRASGGTVRMGLVEIDELNNVQPTILLTADFPLGKCEKNWVLFSHGGELLAAYSLVPHLVLKVDPVTGKCVRHCVSAAADWVWPYGEIRGGTNVVRIGDHYLGMFHSMMTGPEYERMHPMSTVKADKHYFQGWYKFEVKAPFRIVAASRKPVELPHINEGSPVSCCFPVSMIPVEAGVVEIWYGENDNRTRPALCGMFEIGPLLKPVATAKTPLGVIRAA